MIGRMITHDINDGRTSPPSIVKIRRPVGQAGSNVQQGCRRLACDSGITIGRTGGHTLVQTKYRPYPRFVIKGRDKLHLAGARVGKTGLDAVVGEGPQYDLGTIHDLYPMLPLA